jgi:hypothetical protein
MKTFMLLFLTVGFAVNSSGQTHLPQSINSGGAILQNGSHKHSFSLGQTIAFSAASDQGYYTNGFQQTWTVPLACLGDFSGDGYVGTPDLLILLGSIGCSIDCTTDLTGDDAITISDILSFLNYFGNSCGS